MFIQITFILMILSQATAVMVAQTFFNVPYTDGLLILLSQFIVGSFIGLCINGYIYYIQHKVPEAEYEPATQEAIIAAQWHNAKLEAGYSECKQCGDIKHPDDLNSNQLCSSCK